MGSIGQFSVFQRILFRFCFLLTVCAITLIVSSCQQSTNIQTLPTVTVTVTAKSDFSENQKDDKLSKNWQQYINVKGSDYRITEDTCAGVYENSIYVDFTATNISGRDIVYLEGNFYIYDLDDRELFVGLLRYDKEFKRGETIKMGTWDNDCYGLSESNYLHRILLNIFVPSTQTTTDYSINRIIFDNGEAIDFS